MLLARLPLAPAGREEVPVMNFAELLPKPRWRRDPPRPWHTPEYCEYMHSPAWQATRERAFAVRGRACEQCGRMGPLEIHHVHYFTLGHERPEDLRVLCRFCHAKADRARRPARGGAT
jgi:5-methylcytosine-specific restriction endonuclease McrA